MSLVNFVEQNDGNWNGECILHGRGERVNATARREKRSDLNGDDADGRTKRRQVSPLIQRPSAHQAETQLGRTVSGPTRAARSFPVISRHC